MDPHGRHAAMISTRGAAKASTDVTAGVSSFKAAMTLNDDRFLDVVPEAWWGGPSAVMMTVFPSVIFQQQVNSVSTRQYDAGARAGACFDVAGRLGGRSPAQAVSSELTRRT